MMHDNNGMVDRGKTSMKTGDSVKKPEPVLDCNKDMKDWGDTHTQNGPAVCILPYHVSSSEGI